MKTINLDNDITACDLEQILKAGTNITITKIDNCTLEISAAGGGGSANGLKYHLQAGDDITTEAFFQYHLGHNFILEVGSKFTIKENGQLYLHNGYICNLGVINNEGQIINV